jgi:hypothetical protein
MNRAHSGFEFMYVSALTNSGYWMNWSAGLLPCAVGEQIGDPPQPAKGSGNTRPSDE